MVGASMAVDSPLAVVMEVLPLEGPMDTPVLGDSRLELRVDYMVVYLQGAPTVSHLQVPMVPSSLDLMDRVSSTFSFGTQCRTFRPDPNIRVLPEDVHLPWSLARAPHLLLCCSGRMSVLTSLKSSWLTTNTYFCCMLSLLVCQQLQLRAPPLGHIELRVERE